ARTAGGARAAPGRPSGPRRAGRIEAVYGRILAEMRAEDAPGVVIDGTADRPGDFDRWRFERLKWMTDRELETHFDRPTIARLRAEDREARP
ncbi:MAG: hypothetical protein ACLFTL_10715, partial [Alphaproteobacteria bacterium]